MKSQWCLHYERLNKHVRISLNACIFAHLIAVVSGFWNYIERRVIGCDCFNYTRIKVLLARQASEIMNGLSLIDFANILVAIPIIIEILDHE